MKITAILDIGSSKVVCAAVSRNSRGALFLHGVGTCPYSGFYIGALPATASLTQAVAAAITLCESEAKFKISSICVGVPAPFTRTRVTAARLESKFGGARITVKDVDKLIKLSSPMNPPQDCELMHSTPFDFIINGNEMVEDPVGMSAQSLEASVSHIYVDSEFTEILRSCLQAHDIGSSLFVSSAIADSHYIIPQEFRNEGAILIDCGGNHSDVSLIRGDAVFETISIGIGGNHITSDLAMRLRLPTEAAEELKRRYDFFDTDLLAYEKIYAPREGYVSIKRSVISSIIKPRVEELAECISDAITDLLPDAGADTRIYMTGAGISPLYGGIEYLSDYIGMHISASVPLAALDDDEGLPGRTTALALAQFMLCEYRGDKRFGKKYKQLMMTNS